MKLVRWSCLVLALSALVVVGCGSDEEDSATAAGTTSTQDAAEGPQQCNGEKVRFQLSFFPNAQHVGYLVAAAEGFYEDEGLDVKIVPGGPTVNPPLQLAQGTVDLAQMDFADGANAKAGGADITWIAQTYQQNPLRYISLKSVPLAEPADLEGKTVGVQQSGELIAELQGMLEAGGLDEDAVEVKPIGFTIEDLVGEKIDVFPLQTFFHVAQLEAADLTYPDDVNVLDPNQYESGVAAQGVAINTEFAEKNPAVAECFLRASIAGWEMAVEDPEAALEDLGEYVDASIATPEENRVNIEQTLELVTNDRAGEPVDQLLHPDPELLQESLDQLSEYGIVEGEVDLEEFVDPAPHEAASAAAE